jgi:hypothetical protein
LSLWASTKVASKSNVTRSGAKPPAHTPALACARAALTRVTSESSIAFKSRHAVGCDATGPNNTG